MICKNLSIILWAKLIDFNKYLSNLFKMASNESSSLCNLTLEDSDLKKLE